MITKSVRRQCDIDDAITAARPQWTPANSTQRRLGRVHGSRLSVMVAPPAPMLTVPWGSVIESNHLDQPHRCLSQEETSQLLS
jgi:hypothetical protein